jgi:AcrR family transcriptional regulator
MTLRSGAPVDDLTSRERILAGAEKLFAERGFDRTSTARIATEAGVPHGLIFYHFKTKMDLLLAVIRDDRVTALDDLLPPLDPGADLRAAVAGLWRQLSSVLGEPSTARKIVIQELDSHPEIRQRALELHDRIVTSVSAYLAQASQGGPVPPGHEAQPGSGREAERAPGHEAEPRPEHVAAARLLTITAGMAPLLGEPSLTLVPPDALAVLISDGLRPRI